MLLLPFLALLSHCSSSSTSKGPLPTLESPARAKAWGSPKTTSETNGYKLTYTNPSNDREKVIITGSRDPMFTVVYPPNLKGTRVINGVPTQVSEPQLWKKALIGKKTVKWYHAYLPDEQDGAVFHTLPAELKDSNGSPGIYQIEVQGTKNQMLNWLSELKFRLE